MNSIENTINQYNKIRAKTLKKSVMRVFRNLKQAKMEKFKKVSRMMIVIRKYHTFWQFHKYRRIIHWEVQMKSKDSIQGAYLLLKRYKNRLKGFDQTLLTMNENKVEKTAFNELKMSVDRE